MAENNSKRKKLIAERARALAIVCLTRRPDLGVEDVKDDLGVDLLVRLTHEDRPGLRQLGVELRGVWKAVSQDEANKVLRPSLQQVRRYGPFPFPVCLFMFTMENDQGWFTWVAEPVVNTDGTFNLHLHESASCKPLSDEVVDQIVERVDRWYDAFFGNLIYEEPRGKVGKK
jgi:hypothetical protein